MVAKTGVFGRFLQRLKCHRLGFRLAVARLFQTDTLMKPLAECRLYTFVDTGYMHGRSASSVAQELCLGGADLIQLRAKDRSTGEIRKLAEEILAITRKAGVGLVINDFPEIAREIGADYCHLGQEDFFDAGYHHVSELKSVGSPGIGLSTHAPVQAERAITAGADYIAIGPVFATGTKPKIPPVTLQYVRWAAANLYLPWFA